jgi:transcription initiation factor TFIIIB Brf1 subunit/transcription initiation factor TFIIB
MIDETICRFCKTETPIKVSEREGTSVCTICGNVQSFNHLSYEAEKRNFESGSADHNRAGAVVLNGKLPSLTISGGGSITPLSQKMMNSYEQTPEYVKQGVRRLCGLVKLQVKIARRGEEILEEAHLKLKTFKGHSLEAVSAAIVILTAKEFGIIVPPHDVITLAGADPKKTRSSYKKIREAINPLDLTPNDSLAVTYAVDFCEKHRIMGDLRRKIAAGVKKIEELRILDGKRPSTIAYSIMYLMAKRKNGLDMSMFLTQCDTSEKTLRSVHRELETHEDELLSFINS